MSGNLNFVPCGGNDALGVDQKGGAFRPVCFAPIKRVFSPQTPHACAVAMFSVGAQRDIQFVLFAELLRGFAGCLLDTPNTKMPNLMNFFAEALKLSASLVQPEVLSLG